MDLRKFKKVAISYRGQLCQPGEVIVGILRGPDDWASWGIRKGYLRIAPRPEDERYVNVYWTADKGEKLKQKIVDERERKGKIF